MTWPDPVKTNAERFLVDTTLWIRFLRETDDALRERLRTFSLEDRACTCEIVMLEILRGARTEKEFGALRDDFLALPQMAISREVWDVAWRTGYQLRKKGVNVPSTDVLIASVAIYYRLTLLHADAHFAAIAKHTGLKAVAV